MQGVAVGIRWHGSAVRTVGRLKVQRTNSDESLSDASESREQATAISRWERS